MFTATTTTPAPPPRNSVLAREAWEETHFPSLQGSGVMEHSIAVGRGEQEGLQDRGRA